VRPDSGSFPVFVSIADKRLTSLATDCALLLGTDSGGQLTDGEALDSMRATWGPLRICLAARQ
jgi:hypothetical protein